MTLSRFVAFIGVLLAMIAGLVSPSAYARSYLEAAQKKADFARGLGLSIAVLPRWALKIDCNDCDSAEKP